MLILRVSLPTFFALLLLSLACGCSGTTLASSTETTAEAQPAPDGVVRVPEASLPFIQVTPVAATENAAVLRAPARVAFRSLDKMQIFLAIGTIDMTQDT